ncbi:MAG: DUF6512 family protein [Pseudomonadota bacterium]
MLMRKPGWRELDLLATIPIFVAGSALHFAYGWLGQWLPAALFAAVNESVWEHLKIAFWPALLWAVIQVRLGRPPEDGYWAARSFGLFAMSVLIIIVFYSYTAILGENLLLLDIATFAIAILVGQTVSNLALRAVGRRKVLPMVGMTMLLLQLAAFAAFTFAPPHLMLFQDGRNGLYGVSAYGDSDQHQPK